MARSDHPHSLDHPGHVLHSCPQRGRQPQRAHQADGADAAVQITSVSPDAGGDGRYVHVTIEGARFHPNAIVKLIRPQVAEYEPVSYQVVNSFRIEAKFDLLDAPQGLYDIQVTNPNGQVARVPYRYLVEPALPLDLTVGIGGKGKLEIGETGWYGLGLYSLTNVSAPYVHLEFGVPRVANSSGGIIPGEALVFRTNLYGQPRLDDVPWAEVDPTFEVPGRGSVAALAAVVDPSGVRPGPLVELRGTHA